MKIIGVTPNKDFVLDPINVLPAYRNVTTRNLKMTFNFTYDVNRNTGDPLPSYLMVSVLLFFRMLANRFREQNGEAHRKSLGPTGLLPRNV